MATLQSVVLDGVWKTLVMQHEPFGTLPIDLVRKHRLPFHRVMHDRRWLHISALDSANARRGQDYVDVIQLRMGAPRFPCGSMDQNGGPSGLNAMTKI